VGNDKKEDKSRNHPEKTGKNSSHGYIIHKDDRSNPISNTNPPPRFPPKGRDQDKKE
jgi:hypothetical protein